MGGHPDNRMSITKGGFIVSVDAVAAREGRAQNFIPNVLKVSEVAALLRCAKSTVYKYKECDGLPCHQPVPGGAVRFYEHEVLEWMDRKQPSSTHDNEGVYVE